MPQRSKDAYNAYMKDYMLKRYHLRMEQAREYLGGKCVRCGGKSDLHLHHQDPAQKVGTVAGRIWSLAQEKFWLEVAKCVLLCDECHRNEHRVENDHGTLRRYHQGCKCGLCKKANAVSTAEYRKKHGRKR